MNAKKKRGWLSRVLILVWFLFSLHVPGNLPRKRGVVGWLK